MTATGSAHDAVGAGAGAGGGAATPSGPTGTAALSGSTGTAAPGGSATAAATAPGTGSPVTARLLPRGVVVVVALAALWIAISGMQHLAGLIVPVFLALNLMIAVHPLGRAIHRAGLPRIVGALADMLVVLVALFAFFVAIGWAVAQLVAELPSYGPQFNALIASALDELGKLGVSQTQINSWVSTFNFSSLFGLLNQALSSVGSVAALLAAAVATIVFFGLDASGLPDRLAVIARTHPSVHVALGEFAGSVRTYWLVTTLFGAVVSVIDGLALWALGVPLPAVWAVLLFLCNYIPNIGFIFAMIPPTLMALLDEGPVTALLVVLVCSVVAMLLQGLVQPRVTGRAVGVSASVSFLSVLFWSWVLGAAGALLSVPMTLLVKELLVDADPQARWLNAFLADDPAAAEGPQPGEEPAGGDVATSGADGSGTEAPHPA